MKKTFLLSIICVLLLSIAMMASGAEKMSSVKGSIQSFDCIMEHKMCPIGQEDVVAASDEVLVLLVNPEKADYYVIPNVNQKVLARHLNEEVTLVGYLDEKHNSIWAEEIYKGKKLVWGKKMQREYHHK